VKNGRRELEREVMRLYAGAIGIVEPLRVRMWSEAEVTTGQLRLMFDLKQTPGATLGELAALLGVSSPTASGLVDRLTRQGYVRRDGDTQDRRFVRHALTERGDALVSELEREGRALLESVLGELSAGELGSLVAGLEALVGAAERLGVGDLALGRRHA